jgi:hypothetical protein
VRKIPSAESTSASNTHKARDFEVGRWYASPHFAIHPRHFATRRIPAAERARSPFTGAE